MRAAKELLRTSQTKNRSSTFGQRGFSLIEIMVVLSILGAVIAIGLPRIGRTNNNIKKIIREMGVLGKEIRNHARLKNRTYRLVLEMPAKGPHTYYVESADGPVLTQSEETLKKLKDMDERERPKSAFSKDDRILKKDRELPSNLFFGRVQSADRDEAVTEGTAYVYFLPTGLVEHSVIQITDRKNLTWSLIYNPLTGIADIVENAIDLKDMAGK